MNYFPYESFAQSPVVADETGTLYFPQPDGTMLPCKPTRHYGEVKVYHYKGRYHYSNEIKLAVASHLFPVTIEKYNSLDKKLIRKVVFRNDGLNAGKCRMRTRARAISEPRMVCSFLMVNVLNEKLEFVAIEHGHRERSSIYHHLKTIYNMYHNHSFFRDRMNRICLELSLDVNEVMSTWKKYCTYTSSALRVS